MFFEVLTVPGQKSLSSSTCRLRQFLDRTPFVDMSNGVDETLNLGYYVRISLELGSNCLNTS